MNWLKYLSDLLNGGAKDVAQMPSRFLGQELNSQVAQNPNFAGQAIQGAIQGGAHRVSPPMLPYMQNVQPVAVQPQVQNVPTAAPGYEQAAANYEDAFNRGDYNSPYIIGQDPKNFGYPEDTNILSKLSRRNLQPIKPKL